MEPIMGSPSQDFNAGPSSSSSSSFNGNPWSLLNSTARLRLSSDPGQMSGSLIAAGTGASATTGEWSNADALKGGRTNEEHIFDDGTAIWGNPTSSKQGGVDWAEKEALDDQIRRQNLNNKIKAQKPRPAKVEPVISSIDGTEAWGAVPSALPAHSQPQPPPQPSSASSSFVSTSAPSSSSLTAAAAATTSLSSSSSIPPRIGSSAADFNHGNQISLQSQQSKLQDVFGSDASNFGVGASNRPTSTSEQTQLSLARFLATQQQQQLANESSSHWNDSPLAVRPKSTATPQTLKAADIFAQSVSSTTNASNSNNSDYNFQQVNNNLIDARLYERLKKEFASTHSFDAISINRSSNSSNSNTTSQSSSSNVNKNTHGETNSSILTIGNNSNISSSSRNNNNNNNNNDSNNINVNNGFASINAINDLKQQISANPANGLGQNSSAMLSATMGGGGNSGNKEQQQSQMDSSIFASGQAPSQNLLKQMVQYIQLAVQSGQLDAQILREPFLSSTLQLIYQLSLQIRALQQIQDFKQRSAGNELPAHLLNAVESQVERLKYNIVILQKAIANQQAMLSSSKNTDAANRTSNALNNHQQMMSNKWGDNNRGPKSSTDEMLNNSDNGNSSSRKDSNSLFERMYPTRSNSGNKIASNDNILAYGRTLEPTIQATSSTRIANGIHCDSNSPTDTKYNDFIDSVCAKFAENISTTNRPSRNESNGDWGQNPSSFGDLKGINSMSQLNSSNINDCHQRKQQPKGRKLDILDNGQLQQATQLWPTNDRGNFAGKNIESLQKRLLEATSSQFTSPNQDSGLPSSQSSSSVDNSWFYSLLSTNNEEKSSEGGDIIKSVRDCDNMIGSTNLLNSLNGHVGKLSAENNGNNPNKFQNGSNSESIEEQHPTTALFSWGSLSGPSGATGLRYSATENGQQQLGHNNGNNKNTSGNLMQQQLRQQASLMNNNPSNSGPPPGLLNDFFRSTLNKTTTTASGGDGGTTMSNMVSNSMDNANNNLKASNNTCQQQQQTHPIDQASTSLWSHGWFN